MPRVSVIVPNYNHARFLRQRMTSVLSQTYRDREIILMDDGSKDDSRTVIEGYRGVDGVRIEYNSQNSGSCFKQWNKGVRMASGQYVWIAESDDDADTHFLEKMVAVLESNPSVGLVMCRMELIDENGELIPGYWQTRGERWNESFVCSGKEECKRQIFSRNDIRNTSAVLFRKAAYEQAGYADETLRLSGDWLMWMKILLLSDFAYANETLDYWRVHQASVRNTTYMEGSNTLEDVKVKKYVAARLGLSRREMRDLGRHMAHCWMNSIANVNGRHIPLRQNRVIYGELAEIDKLVIWHMLGGAARRLANAVRRRLVQS
jgi:glycosyltransferase involved in cell wall biosynthesis